MFFRHFLISSVGKILVSWRAITSGLSFLICYSTCWWWPPWHILSIIDISRSSTCQITLHFLPFMILFAIHSSYLFNLKTHSIRVSNSSLNIRAAWIVQCITFLSTIYNIGLPFYFSKCIICISLFLLVLLYLLVVCAHLPPCRRV